MTSQEHVNKLLSAQYPTVFSVSAISDVAEVCGIEYGKALSFIERLKSEGKSTRHILEQLVWCYRPDLLK